MGSCVHKTTDGRRSVAALAGRKAMVASLLLVAAGCDGPPAWDADVSDPPKGADPVSHLRASETSVLHVAYGGQNRVLVAYNDQAGLYDFGPNNTLVDKAVQTNMGLSYSLDAGKTWVRHGPIPVDATCTDVVCPTLLRGDPWLADNGTRVLYAELALTKAWGWR